jgi:hypothetical protein
MGFGRVEPRRRSCFFRRGMSIRLFPPISTRAAGSDYHEDPASDLTPGDELRRGLGWVEDVPIGSAVGSAVVTCCIAASIPPGNPSWPPAPGSPGGLARSKCVQARTADHGPVAQWRRSRPDASALIWSDRGIPKSNTGAPWPSSEWHEPAALLDRRLGPSMASGFRGAFATALPRPMYRITCPSRTRLHARSQVLAMHRGMVYRITGHYPMASPAGLVPGNRTAASAWVAGALAGGRRCRARPQ